MDNAELLCLFSQMENAIQQDNPDGVLDLLELYQFDFFS